MLGAKIDAILKHPKEIKLFNKPLHVSGVYESKIGFENGGVVIPISQAEALFHKSASFLLVTLHNLEDADKVMSYIARLSQEITVKSTSDFIDHYNQFKIIKISGAVIASISFFMGFLAIVSIMSIVINERRYEFGIKRALGISKLRIIYEVVLEVMVLTLLAFVIAYVFSLFLLDFLQHIDKFQGYLSGHIDLSLALMVLLGSVCMSVIGALIPAFIAARIDPIVLIHQGA
jgi:ABC-type antimicrobial peptide transport system permease subunit